ncbi:MAG: efflux RND transporter periplasmic adaptor subunit [Planctomycetales bacterium]|nr:efflux RND transporter periplasmic adaptor subunit [Planctomycetales bacterium]
MKISVIRDVLPMFAAGLLSVTGCNYSDSLQSAPGGSSVVPVKLVSVTQTEVIRTSRQPATVHAFFESEVRAKVFGYVEEITADIGDVVQLGQRLARVAVPELDQQSKTLQAEIELLAAEERVSQAGVELADAALRAAHAKLQQATSERASVEAALAAAEAEFSRTEDMVNRGSLQNRVLDEVRKKRDSQLATKDAILSAVAASEAEVGVAQAQKAAAEARKQSAIAKTRVARSELEQLDVTLSFANVTAPFDGVVTQRQVELGDLIEGRAERGSQPLFVISRVDKVRVRIPVPEKDAPFVQPGDSITVTLPSFASAPAIQASVTRCSGSLDPHTRTMVVEAEIDNPQGQLIPGMFGDAIIEMETKVAAAMLPSRAVRFDASGKAYVYVVDSSNRVQQSEVIAGLDTGNEIEILSGVRPGDRVIGPHLKRFSTGQEVLPL